LAASAGGAPGEEFSIARVYHAHGLPMARNIATGHALALITVFARITPMIAGLATPARDGEANARQDRIV
jgi:hypothetical protein